VALPLDPWPGDTDRGADGITLLTVAIGVGGAFRSYANSVDFCRWANKPVALGRKLLLCASLSEAWIWPWVLHFPKAPMPLGSSLTVWS